MPPKWCIRGASFLVQIPLNSYVRRRRRRALKRVWGTYGVFFFPALITRWRPCSFYTLLLISLNCTRVFFFFSVEEYQCPCLELWTRQWFTAPYSWHLLFFAAAWIGNQCSTHPSKSSSSQKKRRHYEFHPLYLLFCAIFIFFSPTRTAESLMHGHILGQWGLAKRAVPANAIRRAGWTALKGTSGWKVSLLLPSLKQWRITAVAFGWRWFSMELDGLYRMQPGPVRQHYSPC